MKTKYALGFVFSKDLKHVLLIRKNRPAWQKGKLNGLGGHVEKGENSIDTISREIKEETNLSINKKLIKHIGSIEGTNWHSDVFTTIYHGKRSDALRITDEKIVWVLVNKLPKSVIQNLTWLIPISKDVLSPKEGEEGAPFLKVSYADHLP